MIHPVFHPPAGGELDPGVYMIEKSSAAVGYTWYQTATKAYYCMGVDEGIPLQSTKTHTYKPASGFSGSTPAAFLTWAASKLGISESSVEKQFIKIEYAAWP